MMISIFNDQCHRCLQFLCVSLGGDNEQHWAQMSSLFEYYNYTGLGESSDPLIWWHDRVLISFCELNSIKENCQKYVEKFIWQLDSHMSLLWVQLDGQCLSDTNKWRIKSILMWQKCCNLDLARRRKILAFYLISVENVVVGGDK